MSDPAISLDELLLQLHNVKRSGDGGYLAQCPAHEDQKPSLSVSLGRDGRILFRCFAGCSFEQIVGALGLSKQQVAPPTTNVIRPLPKRIVATYDYKDADGTLRFQVVRYEPKDFRQRQPQADGTWNWSMRGVTRVPYRLNELRGQSSVFIVEGEKDADALWKIGLAATTNVGGAGKWRDSDSEYLKSVGVSRVVLLPDNDDPGRKHMEAVARSAKSFGLAVMYLPLDGIAPKGDVSDWLRTHSKDELNALVASKLYVMPKGVSRPDDNDALHENDPYGVLRWPQSDLGAGESFAHRYGERVRFDHRHDQWVVWNCHHWRPDNNREIDRLAHDHVRLLQQEATSVRNKTEKDALLQYTMRLERRAALDNMLAIARSKLPIASDGQRWDRDPWLLGCPNGVVDLRTGELRAGHPDDNITMQAGTPFDPNASAERWLTFLDEVFDGDQTLIAFIQRAMGYSLTGDIREQCFFMCLGTGANGKSTFLSTIAHIFGDYAYTTDTRTFAPNASSADTTPFDLAELEGRRLVMASETRVNSRMNEQAIKNFTGGERINAQRKFGRPFQFQPVGKLWMGLNHQPRVTDDSHGFWRRVRLIPFKKSFTGRADKRTLKTELIAESSGILAWIVAGATVWLQCGLDAPPSVMSATGEYQESQDPIRDYVSDAVITEDSTAEESCARVFLHYREWAHSQGMGEREICTRNTFGRLMGRRFERKHTMSGDRYVGVRLKFTRKDLLSDA